MKFNWGHGIVVTMGIAMSLILVLVYFSYQQTIDLVTEDYYPKQLVYENQIDKQNRITSYNVCYTKLLRYDGGRWAKRLRCS